MSHFIVHSPIGNILIATQNGIITKIDPLTDKNEASRADIDIKLQLQHYFKNPTHTFTLKIHPHGTAFQQRVWQALTTIPSGTTLTYGELAKRLKSSPRAIGQACRRNPIPIIIPCHRVVGASHIGGYAGEVEGKTANIKKWLLVHEGAINASHNV